MSTQEDRFSTEPYPGYISYKTGNTEVMVSEMNRNVRDLIDEIETHKEAIRIAQIMLLLVTGMLGLILGLLINLC